ncbi:MULTISPECIES: alanine--tRNA ligase [Larsenimonas]|uniref:Alanine--tRNA ligase n=1 Tax=Larsenimonas suaedae TaxID=1851019 RepID=A0ABU1GVS6_9GAMM|nr:MULTISPECIES: alanine--tRNA ligase [Larsenimonas]MCM2971990.1 alanine--tRNA ligase [Larsenimonas suaedae]MCM5705374.1 alanine--tRNA ligase [Larsenimonas salina]MDR5895542.1 alanine--tRNA ligase [Larsenimonas suaedae]
MKSAALRQAFLDFFEREGHTKVPSGSLVPENDPTVLFTVAGMAPFKDVFLGREQRPYTRAASAQRCVRAGGKHNDLDNVGYTARHHTFFEMLGNFSFGDYFKREAIDFAWRFLTEELGLPKEKLWITVHVSDDEAASIWLDEVGVSPDRFSRLDEDNFWQMGETGPCGPSSEIFFDHGPEVAGGPPGSPDEDGDRYIEIWNLVFMQYDRDSEGTMNPLPKPSIDTGMGLERMAAVLQGVHSNYEIDLFERLLKAAASATGQTDIQQPSLRVIADHIRSCSFLIADGVLPSNEGRGYVLRRIIRRAVRHGHKLGQDEPFFHTLVEALDQEMGEAHPELHKARAQIERVLLKEEEQFARTLDHGMKLLTDAIETLEGDTLDGDTIFKLYDTYGFPFDLTADVARERGIGLDELGFQRALQAQRDRARAASQFGADYTPSVELEGTTQFTGYEATSGDSVAVIGLVDDDGNVQERIDEGQTAVVVLAETPFYAESGGQVGDTGALVSGDTVFEVRDTQKKGAHHFHYGRVTRGALTRGETVRADVDAERRAAIQRNHSATHLLHEALRRVLGEHVQQKGSLVNEERLRFDFSHFEAVSPEQLERIEAIVNEQILANAPVSVDHMSLDDAKRKGAQALFEAKYGENVRVLTMGSEAFSIELCGGIHVSRTGDIGTCHIVTEAGVAAGVRRIEAVTGTRALAFYREQEDSLERIASMLKARPDQLESRIEGLLGHQRELEKTLEALKAKLASSAGNDLLSEARDINGAKVIARQVDGVSGKDLRTLMDQLKSKLASGVVVLGTAQEGKVSLIAGVTSDLTDRVKAGELINVVAEQVGGKGGGRADMAQAGGKDAAALPGALESVFAWTSQKLD